MKKFQFRLETLLKYRRMQKEQAQLNFSRALQTLSEEKNKLTGLNQQLNQCFDTFKDSQHQAISIEKLKNYNIYIDKIKKGIKEQSERVNNAEMALQDCQEQLQKEIKNCEVVEKLKSHRLLQYQSEVLSEEQKFLDELGLQNFVRKN